MKTITCDVCNRTFPQCGYGNKIAEQHIEVSFSQVTPTGPLLLKTMSVCMECGKKIGKQFGVELVKEK